MVLEHGANPNWIGIWGKSAIYQAVLRDNDLSMIEMLLDYGADPDMPNRDGKSAILLAAHRGPGSRAGAFQETYGIDQHHRSRRAESPPVRWMTSSPCSRS